MTRETEYGSEYVRVGGRACARGKRGKFPHFPNDCRRLDKTIDTARVVLDTGAVFRRKRDRRFLDARYGRHQRSDKVIRRFIRCVINDAVDVSLMAEFARRHADHPCALLPRQPLLARDAGQSARLDRVEAPVSHAQENIGGCQRNRSSRVAVSYHDRHHRHIDLRHLRNEIRDAVRLVAAVGLLARVRSRRVDERDDREFAGGEGTA